MSEKDEKDEGGSGESEESKPEESKAEESKAEAAEAGEAAGADEEPATGSEPGSVPVVEAEKIPERKAAAWGRPLVRLDAAWTKWEVWLCAVVIILETFVLALWVALRGLSTAADGSSKAGLVFRALVGAIALGMIAWFALKKANPLVRRIATVSASVGGLLLARTWGNAGVDWASNLLNWYQQASFVTLWGGLRGIATRLTLLLALLGGSLATAAGKHITIDLVTRYLRPKQRLPVVIAGWIGSSLIMGAAAWGFFDHIAIDDFGAQADSSAGQKISKVASGIGEDWFVARKQLKLDLKTFPKVIKGERYSEYLKGTEWNKWVDENDWEKHYGKEKAELLKIPDDQVRAPIVVIPEKGEPRGELAKMANLVFPIGLLIIALRFLLLCLLSISGHRSVDTESHGDMNVVPGAKNDKHIPAEEVEEKA